MAPEVVVRKLKTLRKMLQELGPYRAASLDQVTEHQLKIERILEILVVASTDLLYHLLREQGVEPKSYRDAFAEAGSLGLLPQDLTDRLQKAAGLRNILAHMYERVDLEILRSSIPLALDDFEALIAHLTPDSIPDDAP